MFNLKDRGARTTLALALSAFAFSFLLFSPHSPQQPQAQSAEQIQLAEAQRKFDADREWHKQHWEEDYRRLCSGDPNSRPDPCWNSTEWWQSGRFRSYTESEIRQGMK